MSLSNIRRLKIPSAGNKFIIRVDADCAECRTCVFHIGNPQRIRNSAEEEKVFAAVERLVLKEHAHLEKSKK